MCAGTLRVGRREVGTRRSVGCGGGSGGRGVQQRGCGAPGASKLPCFVDVKAVRTGERLGESVVLRTYSIHTDDFLFFQEFLSNIGDSRQP